MAVSVFGHAVVRETLEGHLPQVTLLWGPPSVGKWTLAMHLAEHYAVRPEDRRELKSLSADSARELSRFAGTAPFGQRKMVIARLGGASEISLNALLKLLEEPPPKIDFLLLTTCRPLATILSRASIFRVGLLSPEELFLVLSERLGMTAEAARRSSVWGRGRVDRALSWEVSETSRSAVLTLVKALSDGDLALFGRAFKNFDEAALELLQAWVSETLTGNWSLFSETETFGLAREPTLVRKMLLGLSALQGKPKLSVRVTLEPLVASRRSAR